MSNTEKSNESIAAAKNAATNALSSILALKDSNPKVFFGGVGALVIVILFSMMSGGDDGKAKSLGSPVSKNLAVGQKYLLQNPNSFDKGATIRLVPVPGTIAAYDESENDGVEGAECKDIQQGTPVSILNFEDAYGKKNHFAQVKIEDGKCKDKTGWVLSFDLQ
jgi:hypothetical protein